MMSIAAQHPEYFAKTRWRWLSAAVVVGIAMGIQIVFGFAGMVIYSAMHPELVDFSNLSSSVVALPMISGSFFGMAVSGLFIYWLAGLRGDDERDFVLKLYWPNPARRRFLITILICLGFGFTASLLQYIVVAQDALNDMDGLDRMFGPLLSGPYWWWAALGVVVIAPVTEELIFRGFLLSALAQSRIGFHVANFICAFCWAALHAQYNISTLMILLVLGLVLGYSVRSNNSVLPAIGAHMTWNAISLIYMLLRLNGLVE